MVRKSSDARIRANKKYQKKIIDAGLKKRMNLLLSTSDFDLIAEYSKINHLSKVQTIVRSIRYCIDHNINLND